MKKRVERTDIFKQIINEKELSITIYPGEHSVIMYGAETIVIPKNKLKELLQILKDNL